jgi:predicted MFS family arabinose efflux permease
VLGPLEVWRRHRSFRLLSASLALSSLGDWFYNVALVVYVFDRTHSPGWVAAATIARLAPHAIGPAAGALADRFDRLRLMVGSDVTRALLMFALAGVVTVSLSPVLALAIAALSTAVGTVYLPCITTLTTRAVAQEELTSANSALGAIDSAALVIGPALGAVVLALSSPAVAIAVNGVTFVGSALFLRRSRAGLVTSARSPRAPSVAGPSPSTLAPSRITSGARALVASPERCRLSAVDVAHGLLYGLETVLLVLVAERLLGIGAQGVGWLYAAIGVGGVLAAGASRWLPALRASTVLTGALVLVGGALALLALVRNPVLACLVLSLDGAGTLAIDVCVTTGLQRCLPDAVAASAFGALEAVTVAAILVGSVVAPALVATLGLRGTLALAGVTVAMVTVVPLRLVTLS